jgi:hypothetical protein
MHPLFGIILLDNTKAKWNKPSLPPNGMIKPISVYSSGIKPLTGTSSENSAPNLQRTTLVGIRQATHLFGATMSAGVAAAGSLGLCRQCCKGPPSICSVACSLCRWPLVYCRFSIATQIAGANQVPNALRQARADGLQGPDDLQGPNALRRPNALRAPCEPRRPARTRSSARPRLHVRPRRPASQCEAPTSCEAPTPCEAPMPCKVPTS